MKYINNVNLRGEGITVIVSGPVLGTETEPVLYTRKALESVRRCLPESELILSTWKEEAVDGLDYDILIQSDDPGGNTGNVNRQICSRLAGLRKANNEICLCIRSESIIKRLDFMNFLDVFNEHSGTYRFLEHRIVIPATYPACRGELFHIGDWYFFGHKEDLISFWDIPYMQDNLYNNTDDDLIYNPHRYIITSFVKKYYPLKFEKITDITPENKKIYEAVIAENFVVTGFYEYGIESLKYPLTYSFFNKLFHNEAGYTFCEWKELYNEYSGGNETIKKTFYERFMIDFCIPFKRSKIGQLFFKVRSKLFKLNYWE